LVKAKRATQVTKFLADNLPKTEMEAASGKPYILHIITHTYCGKTTIVSNVASRFLNCGVKPEVSPDDFTTILAQKIR
jgi:hypothetical protein